MRLTLLLGLAFAVSGTSAASAADVSGFKIAIGQGTTTLKKKNVTTTKFKALGSLSFQTNLDGVSCQDSLSLERRVKEVVHKQVRYRWILIRGGLPEGICRATPRGAKPAAEKTSRVFLNDPSAYNHVLSVGPLRLRYAARVILNGHLVYHKTLISPVTTKTLRHTFRTTATA
jgi:hypothetical protein